MGDCDALAHALLACGVADTIAAAAASSSSSFIQRLRRQQAEPQPMGAHHQQQPARGVIHRYTTMYTSFKTTIQLSYE